MTAAIIILSIVVFAIASLGLGKEYEVKKDDKITHALIMGVIGGLYATAFLIS